MINPALGASKHDLRILSKYQNLRVLTQDEKRGLNFQNSEEEFKATDRSKTRTFYKGATSMFFGVEPTMAMPMNLIEGPKNHLKKQIDQLKNLYHEDTDVTPDQARKLAKIKSQIGGDISPEKFAGGVMRVCGYMRHQDTSAL